MIFPVDSPRSLDHSAQLLLDPSCFLSVTSARRAYITKRIVEAAKEIYPQTYSPEKRIEKKEQHFRLYNEIFHFIKSGALSNWRLHLFFCFSFECGSTFKYYLFAYYLREVTFAVISHWTAMVRIGTIERKN